MTNSKDLETALIFLMSSCMKMETAIGKLYDLHDEPPLMAEEKGESLREGREEIVGARKQILEALRILMPEVLENSKETASE